MIYKLLTFDSITKDVNSKHCVALKISDGYGGTYYYCSLNTFKFFLSNSSNVCDSVDFKDVIVKYDENGVYPLQTMNEVGEAFKYFSRRLTLERFLKLKVAFEKVGE